MSFDREGHKLTGFPALVDHGGHVGVGGQLDDLERGHPVGFDPTDVNPLIGLERPACFQNGGPFERGDGQVVNIGSMLGAVKYPFFASYSSAKAGLQGLSEGLRREIGGGGIAVTYIAPRAARTAFNSPAVMRFMELTKMKTDEPEFVADRIVAAILERRKEVFIGFQERLFMRLNALVPRLIDMGISPQAAKARHLFQ